jgi:hypothetical protein
MGAEIVALIGIRSRTVQPVASRCTDWAVAAQACQLLSMEYKIYRYANLLTHNNPHLRFEDIKAT